MGDKSNDRRATSVPVVFAVGDCVESYEAILRSLTISQLGTNAIRQVKTCAQTICGKRSRFSCFKLNGLKSR